MTDGAKEWMSVGIGWQGMGGQSTWDKGYFGFKTIEKADGIGIPDCFDCVKAVRVSFAGAKAVEQNGEYSAAFRGADFPVPPGAMGKPARIEMDVKTGAVVQPLSWTVTVGLTK